MDLSTTAIPQPLDSDEEDVHWALSTATALWSRGESSEALKWLRRAAETASDAEDDDRALLLFKAAADVTAFLATAAAQPPPSAPAPAPVQPVQSYAPQQAQAPQPVHAPPRPIAGQAGARPPSVPAPRPSGGGQRPPSVPAPPAPPAPPRPASVPAPTFERGTQPQASFVQPRAPEARAFQQPPAAETPPEPRRAPAPRAPANSGTTPEAPPVAPATPAARVNPAARSRRPPPSEIETVKQARPQITSQIPTSRPPPDALHLPAPAGIPLAPISGSSALERPTAVARASQARTRPSNEEEVTAQRDLSELSRLGVAGFDDLDEETNVLEGLSEAADLLGQFPPRPGSFEDPSDDTSEQTSIPRAPVVQEDLGSTRPDPQGLADPSTVEADSLSTRKTIDVPRRRRGVGEMGATLPALRVVVLRGDDPTELRLVPLAADENPPAGTISAVLVPLSADDGTALLRMLSER